MNISSAGLDAIKAHEGLRLFAYLDAVGVVTIGHGHTKGVRAGQHITLAEAEAFLREDMAWVERCIAANVRVPLTQGQYDALCSLIFNIGGGAFKESTLLRMLNAGDYGDAADQFPRWNKGTVNGAKVELRGLTTRRAAERAMFLADPPLVHLGPEPAEAYIAPDVRVGYAPYTQPRPDQEPYTQEAPMPIPAIVGALLPELIGLIPKLGGLFGSGSKVSERNMAAAGAVLDIASKATQAVNAQDAIEKMRTDPTMLASATRAIEAEWYSLTEAGGGGIDGARKADAAAMAKDGPWWQVVRSPSFVVALLLLPMVYLILGNVTGLYGAEWSPDARAGIAGSIAGGIVMGLIGYYYGQSTSRNRTPAAPDEHG